MLRLESGSERQNKEFHATNGLVNLGDGLPQGCHRIRDKLLVTFCSRTGYITLNVSYEDLPTHSIEFLARLFEFASQDGKCETLCELTASVVGVIQILNDVR